RPLIRTHQRWADKVVSAFALDFSPVLGIKPGRRARASRRRLSMTRTAVLAVFAVFISAMAGSLAYFLPAAKLAWDATGQVVSIASPTPSPSSASASSPTPTPANLQGQGAFTVLLLGS